MKVEQQVPLLLVERQALNEAMEGEKMVVLYLFIYSFVIFLNIYLLYFLLIPLVVCSVY